jgi:hypothetical protein
MPGRDPEGADGGGPPKLSVWQRLSGAVLKPVDPDRAAAGETDDLATVSELEEAIKHADDKERLVGLIVTGTLLANDPAAPSKLHVSPSLYTELGGLAVVLAVAMLASAWYRKRLYLGIIMALYGLNVLNLHYWGFGLPFIVAGAWLLVRAYRLQTRLKLAKAEEPGGGPGAPNQARPNKRYTPPTPPPGRSSKSKPGTEPG